MARWWGRRGGGMAETITDQTATAKGTSTAVIVGLRGGDKIRTATHFLDSPNPRLWRSLTALLHSHSLRAMDYVAANE